MGKPTLGSRPTSLPQMREETVTLAEQAVSTGRRVYTLVNNRTEGSAPWTVQAIYDRLAGRRTAFST
jgi:hypothetical protein